MSMQLSKALMTLSPSLSKKFKETDVIGKCWSWETIDMETITFIEDEWKEFNVRNVGTTSYERLNNVV